MTQSFDVDVVPDAADPNLIHVRTPGGGAAKVTRAELFKALQQGATPMTPEEVDTQRMHVERGTLGQQALTFGEAGLSTMTLGASDFIGAELDPEWAQATKERREVNPNVTLAGEIVGAVAPAIASGGTSAVARGVSAIGAPMAALGRAGMLAESGVMAGARALGMTGQSLAGRAVLRGLGSAAAGALEGGAFEITRGMVASVLDDTEYTAEKLTADIKKGVKWGAVGGGVVGVGSTLIGAAGRKAVDSILQGRTLEEAAKDIADNRHVRSVVGDLGALGERSKEIGQKIVAADIPMTGGAVAREAVERQAVSSADNLVAAARKLDEAGIAVPEATANRMRKLGVDEVTEALDNPPLPVVDQPVDEVLEAAAAPAPKRSGPWEALARARNAADDPEALDTMLASVDGVIDDELVARAAAGDETARIAVAQTDEAKGALGKAIEDARDWNRVARVIRKSDEVKDVTGQVMTVVDILRTLAMGGIGGIPGMVMSAASSTGRKFLQERGQLWLAKMAKGMARADSRINRAVKGLGGERVGIAANKTSAGIVGEPDWTGVLLEEAFSDQSPAAPALRNVATQAGVNYEERYNQLVSQVRTFRDDPKEAASILEAATGGLAEEHPEVAAAVHQQILSDAAYIDERLGLGQRLSLNPLAPRLPVTREEKLVALDIADALNDPPAVAEALAAGRYNAEQWAALEARRPKLYSDFRSQAMRELFSRYDEIATDRRIMVGTALKFPADWSLVPENEAALMSATVPPEEQSSGMGGPAVNPSAAEMMATPAQTALDGG